MNIQTKTKPPPDYHGHRGDLLQTALDLLLIQADRLDSRGVDTSATRGFVERAKREAWPVPEIDRRAA